jgi:hypothetical protein
VNAATLLAWMRRTACKPAPIEQTKKKSADRSTLFFIFWLPDLDSNQGPAD